MQKRRKQPGKLLTLMGAGFVAIGAMVAYLSGQASALLQGWGASHVLDAVAGLGELAQSSFVAVLLGAPAAYGALLIAESYVSSRPFLQTVASKTRVLIGSLWAVVAATALVNQASEGIAVFASVAAACACASGLALLRISNLDDGAHEAFRRIVATGLFLMAAMGTASAAAIQGIELNTLNGLLASVVVTGTAMLFVGAIQDYRLHTTFAARGRLDRMHLESALQGLDRG